MTWIDTPSHATLLLARKQPLFGEHVRFVPQAM